MISNTITCKIHTSRLTTHGRNELTWSWSWTEILDFLSMKLELLSSLLSFWGWNTVNKYRNGNYRYCIIFTVFRPTTKIEIRLLIEMSKFDTWSPVRSARRKSGQRASWHQGTEDILGRERKYHDSKELIRQSLLELPKKYHRALTKALVRVSSLDPTRYTGSSMFTLPFWPRISGGSSCTREDEFEGSKTSLIGFDVYWLVV